MQASTIPLLGSRPADPLEASDIKAIKCATRRAQGCPVITTLLLLLFQKEDEGHVPLRHIPLPPNVARRRMASDFRKNGNSPPPRLLPDLDEKNNGPGIELRAFTIAYQPIASTVS